MNEHLKSSKKQMCSYHSAMDRSLKIMIVIDDASYHSAMDPSLKIMIVIDE